MSEVKALFPIGKTQWRKWNDMQRNAFNALMAQGKSFPDAVALANAMSKVFKEVNIAPEPAAPKRTRAKRKVK
jgi:hypothetical protein